MDISTNLYKWLTRTDKDNRQKWLDVLRVLDDKATLTLQYCANTGALELSIQYDRTAIYVLEASMHFECYSPSEYHKNGYTYNQLNSYEIGYLIGALEFYNYN